MSTRSRPKGSTIIYTTGYTTNSASLQCLLRKSDIPGQSDIAIVDMAVHASVHEGLLKTKVKSFAHNNLEALEHNLRKSKGNYRTMMVIVDGVYSQDGDIAPLKEIIDLTHSYGGIVVVDDAHGIGVVGATGRGALEMFDVLNQADIITGTFSKTFSNVGGYLIADPELITYLQFQSWQYAFSASSLPSACAKAS